MKRRSDRPVEHILLVSYLYSPANVVPVHRPVGLRRAFQSAGIRTTVLTSKISGSCEDDEAQRIIRAGDLRTCFHTQYQTLVGYKEGSLAVRGKPRRWTNYVSPDVTVLSWFPQALFRLLKLIRSDRPDVIITTSGPESSHLLGLVARAFRIPWIADYRDPWLRDASHPFFLRWIDRLLERRIARRATAITAINEEIALDVRRRQGVPAFHISNGFDRTAIENASDERATLDSKRFSLVHTGLLGIDATDDPVLHRGRDGRMFFDALEQLLAEEPELAGSFEFVLAGTISDAERRLMTRGDLAQVVRVLGKVSHARALGVQQAADSLLLIPGGADATTAKVFEYLAAQRPIFAVTEKGSVSAELLAEAGEHTIAPPDGVESLAKDLRAHLRRWMKKGEHYEPRPEFDLDAYEYENLGRKMLALIDSDRVRLARKTRRFRRAGASS